MAKKHLRKAQAAAIGAGTATIEVSARRVGNSVGWTVPAPVVRSHHLEAGSKGMLHVERDVRRHVVRYVIEVPEGAEGAEGERLRHPVSWYLARAAARGLGLHEPEELLPADAPKSGEIW
ncbi:MAG: hypothetical protein H0W83_07690 [Planctomycetes bacterium]|nr:hypothetical protein [Planctomycetota bacterium]